MQFQIKLCDCSIRVFQLFDAYLSMITHRENTNTAKKCYSCLVGATPNLSYEST